MQISKLQKNNITIFRILDQVDMYCVKDLRESLEDTLDSGKAKIVINIENLDYIDSSGIALLYSFNQKLIEKGHKLRLVVNQNKTMLLSHFSVEKHIPLFFKEDNALNSFL
ncbi:MAG: STAS domain-containing protein [Leptospiraceae bacterium]|nr:STAS domain-containing protein [Leptospiraceae bacterium]